jgi:hypothetical protein
VSTQPRRRHTEGRHPINARWNPTEPTCICGALLDGDRDLCRKCSARCRWQRRTRIGRRHVRPGRSTPSDPLLS